MKLNLCLSCVVVCLLLAVFCRGEEKKEMVRLPESRAGTMAEKSEEKQQPPPQKEAKKEKKWPQPFQPSEKVSADAVISFPTDI